jgi:hypothetical protein
MRSGASALGRPFLVLPIPKLPHACARSRRGPSNVLGAAQADRLSRHDVEVNDILPGLCLSPAIRVTGTLDAGSLLVALATLALALITWRLARTTKESVGQATLSAEAARESVDAERASVEAMQMPYVIAIPVPYDELIAQHGEDYRDVEAAKVPREIHVMGTALEGLSLRMRLANIGAGPAITDGLSLVLNRLGDLLELDATQVPIAAGGWRDVDLPLSGQQQLPLRTAA